MLPGSVKARSSGGEPPPAEDVSCLKINNLAVLAEHIARWPLCCIFKVWDVNMLNLVAVLIIVVAAILAAMTAWRLVCGWLKYRGRMVITCPENQRPAGVSVDARHAAAASLGGKPEFHLTHCSRWPENAGCGRECLRQIETSPENCLLHNILVAWYAGKNCAWCGRSIGDIRVTERRPTVLLPDQSSAEWQQIPAERLPETLKTALPLCFGCHIANTMRGEHPELVIDRSRPAMRENP